MATITYKSLTALQPVELNYNFYTDESLTKSTQGYEEGYNFNTIEGLNNFQDIAINKNTCFILTSAVLLSSIFTKQKDIKTGQIPATINLQPINSTIYYLGYNIDNDSVISTYKTPQNFFIIPVNDKEIEIKVGNFYLEVDDNYPHRVYASNLILTPDQIRRRRFKFLYQNNQISLIAQTQYGDRYLSLGNDNILRATGIVLGNNLVNNYVFKVINVTAETLSYNFKPDNTWTTYFFDFANQTNNTDISINKEVNNIYTNFLISFAVGRSANQASVNIANLKTGLTPTGCTATLNNSYEEEIITSN